MAYNVFSDTSILVSIILWFEALLSVKAFQFRAVILNLFGSVDPEKLKKSSSDPYSVNYNYLLTPESL